MACEILHLEKSHPEVCQEFKKENSLVQLRETIPFGICESDKVLETAINKNTATPGRLTGFITKKRLVDVGLERFTKALISLHEFTGCITVSAFTGLRKAKAFRKMARNVEYVYVFGKLSKEWHLEEEMLEVLEAFVRSVYGYDGMEDVNLLRY